MSNCKVLDLLKWAETKLERSGVERARQDAEALLIYGCRIRKEDIFLNNPELCDYDINLFKRYVRQRTFRRPLQFILKSTEFMGIPLLLEEGIFIPRPETELLVEKVLENIKAMEYKSINAVRKFGRSEDRAFSNGVNILEIGTGSGNIAISLTKNATRCRIIASDVSERALEVASRNARLAGVSERIKFLKSDLFDNITNVYNDYFDIIISNPPYVKRDEIEHLQAEIAYEDAAALDGGKDGLYFYRRILGEGIKYLKNGGIFAIEIGHNQAKDVRGIIAKDSRFLNTVSFKDYSSFDRIILTEFRYSQPFRKWIS